MVLQYIAFAAGVGASIMQGQHAKKMAKKQAALAKKEAAKLRERSAQATAAMNRELETLRVQRSLDLPAFQQARQMAFLNASKAAERVARSRTMGRMGDEVREAMFGGQFNEYVGRRLQEFQQHAALTQQLFEGTKAMQDIALQYESQASQISYGGQAQAIQTEGSTGDTTANILGATAQALALFSQAKDEKEEAAKKAKQDFIESTLANPEFTRAEALKRIGDRYGAKTSFDYGDLFSFAKF